MNIFEMHEEMITVLKDMVQAQDRQTYAQERMADALAALSCSLDTIELRMRDMQ